MCQYTWNQIIAARNWFMPLTCPRASQCEHENVVVPAQVLLLNHECAMTVRVLPHSDDSQCFPDEGIIVPFMWAVSAQQDRRETYELGTTRIHVCYRSGGKLRSKLTAEICSLRLWFNGITPKLMQKDVQNGLRASPFLHAAPAGTDGVSVCWCQVRAWHCQGRHEESRCSKRGSPDLVAPIIYLTATR